MGIAQERAIANRLEFLIHFGLYSPQFEDKYGGSSVGVGTLAAFSEEEYVIEELYEPCLIETGVIDRTPVAA